MEPVTFEEKLTAKALPIGRTLFLLFLLVFLEIAGAVFYRRSLHGVGVHWLLFVAFERIAGVFLIVGFLSFWGYGRDHVGLSQSRLGRGLLHGLLWCCGFGVLVGCAGAILHRAGIPMRSIFGAKRFQSTWGLVSYVMVACLLGPMVEDLVFIGLFYNSLRRRFPLFLSIAIVVPFFAAAHGYISLSLIIQGIGAILFTLSFEYSGSLLTPMIIHACGNMAILAISFF